MAHTTSHFTSGTSSPHTNRSKRKWANTGLVYVLIAATFFCFQAANAADPNLKTLLIYNAYPRSINQGGAGTFAGASAELGQYDYLVLGGEHEKPYHWDYANTVAILAHPDLDNTAVFGAIDAGVNSANHTMDEIKTRVDEWKVAGATGIYLDYFGYNWGTSRARQNEAVDYVHSQGMPVLANAFFPADAFGDAVDPTYNSAGVSTHLDSTDFYLYEAHQFMGGQIYAGFIWYNKANEIKGYQDETGFKVFSYTTNDEANVYDENNFFYSWYSALLFGHEATGWGEFAYSGWGANSAELAPFRNRPMVDPGTVFTGDVLNPETEVYTRAKDLGTITVNTLTHAVSFTEQFNSPPQLVAIGNPKMEVGATRHITVSASDPDGTISSLSATGLPFFATFVDHGTGTGTLSLTPNSADEGSYSIQLIAVDAIDPLLTDSQTLTLTVTAANLNPKDLLIFGAYPRSINQGGAGTVAGASAELGQYDYLVLGGGHEKTDHWDYANTVAILAHPDLTNTTVFGEVSIGVSVVNHSIAEIKTRIDEWKAAGAAGIFLNHFGYNWGADRTRQNDAIQHAHDQSMLVLAEAFVPADAFDAVVDPVHNPGGIATKLNAADFYLYEAHQVANGQIYEDFIWQDKANQIQTYQDALGFGVFSYTTNNDANLYDQTAFFYSWYSALLYGHQATGWGEYANSGWGVSAEQAPFRQRPVVNPVTVFTSAVQTPATEHYTRTTDVGTIAVNASTQVGRISYHLPVAVADDYSVDEDGTLTVAAPGLMVNDSDADQEQIAPVLISGPQNGAVALAADGSFIYAPTSDFSGMDSFTYQAVDEAYVGSTPVTVTITVNYVDGVQPDDNLAPKTLLFYYGYPSSVNGATSIAEASAVFGAYDYVVLAGVMQEEDHPDHQNTIDIIRHPNMVGTTVFAYITLGFGVDRTNFSIEEIQTRMVASQAAGVDGIFLDEFDYGDLSVDDPGVTRERQNLAIDYAHSLDMPVVANAFLPASAFSDEVHPLHNPDGASTHLGPGDFYLFESHQVRLGEYVPEIYWQGKANELKGYQDLIGFDIFSITTADETDSTYFEDAFFYAWYSALLYGHEATGWGESILAASGPSAGLAPFRVRPTISPGTVFTNEVQNPEPNLFARSTDLSTVTVNTITHAVNFFDPGSTTPQLAALGNPELEVGETQQLTVMASNLDGTIPILSATGLPAFASFVDQGDGTGTLALAPGAGSDGTYTIQLSAANAVNPVLTDSQILTVTVAPVSIAPKDLLIYYGYPRSINGNGAGTVESASAALSQYNYLVLGGGHEKSDHWDYTNTVAILAHPDLINTTVFGEVSVGVNVVNHSLAEIQTRVAEWKAAGADGIFFNHFGYNWGADRARQNAAIGYARSLGMLVLAEAFVPADAFGSVVDPVHNPNGIATSLNASDFYLYDAHQVANGAIYEGFIWQDKASQIQAYQDTLDFSVFSYTTNNDANGYDEAGFFYSWYSALLHGHEATGWGEYANSGWGVSSEQAPFHTRPSVNPGTVFTSDVQDAAPVYTRETDLGTIIVNTLTHEFSVGGGSQPPSAKFAATAVPQDFGLTQNYPNPFNPSTQITYQIAAPGDVALVVFNSLGQSVRTLQVGYQAAGKFKVAWDGRDDAGHAVSSGVYLYRLVSQGSVQTRRMLLLK